MGMNGPGGPPEVHTGNREKTGKWTPGPRVLLLASGLGGSRGPVS